ncbi:MAG: cytochrome c maturation protein CcmE [Chloroflexota bacterium]|nr:cytochrome c maturation protein CcmE [Chloroflexota bacterium]
MSVASAVRRSRGASERRLLAITVLAIAIGIGYVAFQNVGASAVYYLTPTEAAARRLPPGTTTRLGGLVEKGSLRYDAASQDLRFIIGDGVTRVIVIGKGAPPALLREDAGAVVEGYFAADGSFRATQVLAKHDEVYTAPSPSATPAHRTPPP